MDTTQSQHSVPRITLPDGAALADRLDQVTFSRRQQDPELQEAVVQGARLAKNAGLDFYDTIFELVSPAELYWIASQTGFPNNYEHYTHGIQFMQQYQEYQNGLSKISEMVVNTDPCYAYLMSTNSLTDQKMVIVHVYGHGDFFKNNAFFAHTDRNMMNEMGNHAARIERISERIGHEKVEQFIDICLSLNSLIDRHAPGIVRTVNEQRHPLAESPEREAMRPPRYEAKPYMDTFINPPEVMKAELARMEVEAIAKEQASLKDHLQQPTEDVLQLLIEQAPLKPWQREIMSIIRAQAYYFLPQGQTKIMNEGWASKNHSELMTGMVGGTGYMTAAESITYFEHNSKTLFMPPGRMNPYKMGLLLFRDIEERWNEGKFGNAWDNAIDRHEIATWADRYGDSTGLRGREKTFEVRRCHNDVTFIDTFLTREFCERHKLFGFAYNRDSEEYEISSREFPAIKQNLLFQLTNHGRPIIAAVETNHANRGELVLEHHFLGAELKLDYAEGALKALHACWSRPVHIRTVLDDKPVVLSFDGSRFKSEVVAGDSQS